MTFIFVMIMFNDLLLFLLLLQACGLHNQV